MSSTITFIIIGLTAITSYGAFQNQDLMGRLLFWPYRMQRGQEAWRFLTHGLVHADFQHLLFNMLTLYFFGRNIEAMFEGLFGTVWAYPLFYVSALLASALPSYAKYRNQPGYRALGASGAVSAVLFATIVFDPWQTLLLNFFIPVPAILFAVGYVWYSHRMSQQAQDHIGHDAHLWGAVYGFLFPLLLKPAILPYFWKQLLHPHFF